jgi:hypothetical protein
LGVFDRIKPGTNAGIQVNAGNIDIAVVYSYARSVGNVAYDVNVTFSGNVTI